jgi:hypothetical protein
MLVAGELLVDVTQPGVDVRRERVSRFRRRVSIQRRNDSLASMIYYRTWDEAEPVLGDVVDYIVESLRTEESRLKRLYLLLMVKEGRVITDQAVLDGFKAWRREYTGGAKTP